MHTYYVELLKAMLLATRVRCVIVVYLCKH